MAFSTSTIAFCTILSSRDGIEIGLRFRFPSDIDSAERLGLLRSILEPPMKLADIFHGILLVFLVSDAIHPCASILS